MTKEQIKAKNNELAMKLSRAGINIPLVDVQTLRRAEIILREWKFNSTAMDGAKSFQIKRKDDGTPFIEVRSAYIGKSTYEIVDREAEEKGKVLDVCTRNGLTAKIEGGNLSVSRPVVTEVSCRV